MSSTERPRIQTAGALFELVQALGVFPDSKTFPDCTARFSDAEIEGRFEAAFSALGTGSTGVLPGQGRPLDVAAQLACLVSDTRDALRRFIEENFEVPDRSDGDAEAPAPVASMEEHIERMWEVLTRLPTEPPPARVESPPGSTLLELRHPYLVPGGRYVEYYYWDSYFTAVGLPAAGRVELLEGIVANAADLIGAYGRVPNGSRTYYLSRSQVPHFVCMLRLLERARGEESARAYAGVLEQEHAFWMGPGRATSVGPGALDVLNHYWDDLPEPRPEGFREDLQTYFEARAVGYTGDAGEFYRHLRAAAESGWDFSSRWLAPDAQGRRKLHSARTTHVIPIDLNCLLYTMEDQLARWLPADRAGAFRARADRRRELLQGPPLWSKEAGFFFDAVREGDRLVSTGVESLAGVYPLFCKAATPEQAARVAGFVGGAHFRGPGGVAATTVRFQSGEQWDYPNAWAPLQWVTVVGLHNYGHVELARSIARDFVEVARRTFDRTGVMMEKYHVGGPDRPATRGEYPNQVGFGWTNGVVRAFLDYLEHDRLPC